MLASSFCASRPRDATRRMSATELVCAAPSQQRLRRSSVAAALQPSTQLVVFVASLLVSSRCCQQHLEEGCGGTSRGDASCAQHQLRHSSISSVAAAEVGAGSVPRPWAVDGALLGSPSNYLPPGRDKPRLLFELIFLKSLGHSPDRGRQKFSWHFWGVKKSCVGYIVTHRISIYYTTTTSF